MSTEWNHKLMKYSFSICNSTGVINWQTTVQMATQQSVAMDWTEIIQKQQQKQQQHPPP